MNTAESRKCQSGAPGGKKRVPRTPLSLTLILWTPGAMYHLSMSVAARGVRSMKPSVACPLWTEMLTKKGLQTFIFLNLTDNERLQCPTVQMCPHINEQITRVNVLPESFTAAWHWAHAPQQTHVLLSVVSASKAEIICHCRTGKRLQKRVVVRHGHTQGRT